VKIQASPAVIGRAKEPPGLHDGPKEDHKMRLLTPEENRFLDVFLHEATPAPFTGPATNALHQKQSVGPNVDERNGQLADELALLSARAVTHGHPPNERIRRAIFDTANIEHRNEGWVIVDPSAGCLFEIERCVWSSAEPLAFDTPAGALSAFLRGQKHEAGRERRYGEAMIRLGRLLQGPSRYEEESTPAN
jgi:hypothetical protein